MGADARAIIVTKEKLKDEVLESLKSITDDNEVVYTKIDDYHCYDTTYRNTCLTDNINTGNLDLKIGTEYYIIENDGLSGFEWSVFNKKEKSSDCIDTFYEEKDSIIKQAEKAIKDIEAEVNLIKVVRYYLDKNVN